MGGERRFRWRRVAVLAVVAVAIVGLGVGAVATTVFSRLPDIRALATDERPSDTLVYDRTGAVLLADLHPSGSRHSDVSLAAMGRWLPAATNAIDGSVLTQRVVRLRLFGPSADRLLEAAAIARANLTYSHDQILAMYLNSAYYGDGAYGAAAAARTFFGVDAANLDLAQAALLAGLPDRPNALDPRTHWTAARAEQGRVLDAMAGGGAITAAQASAARAEKLTLTTSPDVLLAPGFVAYLVGGLRQRFGQEPAVMGLRVVSSLDWGLQQQAEQAMAQAVQDNRARGAVQGALVAIDPATGGILAMVGAADPNGPLNQTNFATTPRNPGTAARLFTYSAAIASQHYTMVSPLSDGPIAVDMCCGLPAWTPHNYDQRFHGTNDLQTSLGSMLNLPAVEVEMGLGVSTVADTARALGAPFFYQPDANVLNYTTDVPSSVFGPTLTLGGYADSVLQMASAGATLAAGGLRRSPEAVLRATSGSGRVVYAAVAGPGSRALDAGAAFIVSQMLAEGSDRTLTFGADTPLTLAGRHVAALTGTTDSWHDGWALGYTPSLATAVWMGNPSGMPMTTGSDGMIVAAPAWHQFMQGALDRLQKGDEWFTAPAGVDTATVGVRQAWFLPGTSPSTPAPVLPANVHPGG